MALPRLKTVTRTQGNNRALKDGDREAARPSSSSSSRSIR